jgi:hypothetical protein
MRHGSHVKLLDPRQVGDEQRNVSVSHRRMQVVRVDVEEARRNA